MGLTEKAKRGLDSVNKTGAYTLNFYCNEQDCPVREVNIDVKLLDAADVRHLANREWEWECPLCCQGMILHGVTR